MYVWPSFGFGLGVWAMHRKGGGGIWDTKAQHRNTQICVCTVQAEAKASNPSTIHKGSLQHSAICSGQWPRTPCCCCLLQCPKGNSCQETLTITPTSMFSQSTSKIRSWALGHIPLMHTTTTLLNNLVNKEQKMWKMLSLSRVMSFWAYVSCTVKWPYFLWANDSRTGNGFGTRLCPTHFSFKLRAVSL